ncbi:MAG: alpha/beta hydrolase [Candidatus Sulfotelmatobacter sp.]
MTLKIKRIARKHQTRICLSGQLRSENVGQVKAEVGRGGPRVALDLGEVDLVDIDAVRFLNVCESAGVSILHCSPYIREWMVQERSQPKDHPEALQPGLCRTNGAGLQELTPVKGTERKKRRTTMTIKNVVLVHGAFADGSGWQGVAKILKNDGYRVSVAQPPETSYAEDQKYTKAAIDAMGGPVVLVGHSYGGSIITEAGNHPNVAALVYIAAFALDEGESCASIEQALPQASTAFKPDSNGDWWIDEAHFAADFAADIPREEAEFMAISQVPISTDAFTHKVTNPAWKHKHTWYMVATSDRSINPDQERMMAKRAKAKTVEVNASHVAYMSHPKETAKLIEEAATSVPAQKSAAS